jgi:hypothetical protein
VRKQIDVPEADLQNLDVLWPDGLGERYDAYRLIAPPQVALAAALVETAVHLQGLGREVVQAGPLLLGDLCLARASRLLSDAGDQALQVSFASAVEEVSAAAAAGLEFRPVRDLLLKAITTGR